MNAIGWLYIIKLGFKICSTNVDVSKIDSLIFKILYMVLASFQVDNKLEKAWFFQKIFLMTNFDINDIFEIFFFTLSYAKMLFVRKKLI